MSSSTWRQTTQIPLKDKPSHNNPAIYHSFSSPPRAEPKTSTLGCCFAILLNCPGDPCEITLPRLNSRSRRHPAPPVVSRAIPARFHFLHRHPASISRMQATQMQTRSMKAGSARAAAVRPTQVIP